MSFVINCHTLEHALLFSLLVCRKDQNIPQNMFLITIINIHIFCVTDFFKNIYFPLTH